MARVSFAEGKKGITTVYTCGIAGSFLLGTQPHFLSVSSGFENWLRSGNWTGDHEFFIEMTALGLPDFFCNYKLSSTLFSGP